jgi:type IV secretory pathway TrbL component
LTFFVGFLWFYLSFFEKKGKKRGRKIFRPKQIGVLGLNI